MIIASLMPHPLNSMEEAPSSSEAEAGKEEDKECKKKIVALSRVRDYGNFFPHCSPVGPNR